eukprot:200836-Chlamydomonas_euryale.AAC.8
MARDTAAATCCCSSPSVGSRAECAAAAALDTDRHGLSERINAATAMASQQHGAPMSRIKVCSKGRPTRARSQAARQWLAHGMRAGSPRGRRLGVAALAARHPAPGCSSHTAGLSG